MATALNVILTEDSIAGKAGELIKVRPGYARNYLLPTGKAVIADEFNMRVFEERKAELEQQAEERRAASEAIKEKIGEDAAVVITTKAGTSGKLFGAITKEKIAAAISEQLSVQVTKDSVVISEPIKALGQYNVKLNLGSNVTTEVTIKVENEN